MSTPKRRATNLNQAGGAQTPNSKHCRLGQDPTASVCLCALPLPAVERLLPGPCQRVGGRRPLGVDNRTWGSGTRGAQGLPPALCGYSLNPEKPQGMLANVGMVYQYNTVSELALGLTDV